MPSSERNGWIVGLVPIALRGVFLLQNAGLAVLPSNWWALFILIPAFAAFASAWTFYQQDRQFTPRVIGLIAGGLVPLSMALMFLFNFDFGGAWPFLMIVIGAGMLLRSLTLNSGDKPTGVTS